MTTLAATSLSAIRAGAAIFTHLDMNLMPGQIWGVLGPNGAGKTTLLHLLAGLHPPDIGQILLDGQLLQSVERKLRARSIGLLFQDSEDTFPATVLETVMMGRYPHSPGWGWETRQDVEIAMRALEQVSLTAFAQRQIQTLSGGERRRVAIAVLIAQDPVVWLLDEPTNHLDLHQQIQVLERLLGEVRKKNATAVMVLQDVNLVSRFCTHALLMVDAMTHLQGPIADVLNKDNLGALYRHRIDQVQTADGRGFFYPA